MVRVKVTAVRTATARAQRDLNNPKITSGANQAAPASSRTVTTELLNNVRRGTSANPIPATAAQTISTMATYTTAEISNSSHSKSCCGGAGQANQATRTAASKPPHTGVHSVVEREPD